MVPVLTAPGNAGGFDKRRQALHVLDQPGATLIEVEEATDVLMNLMPSVVRLLGGTGGLNVWLMTCGRWGGSMFGPDTNPCNQL